MNDYKELVEKLRRPNFAQKARDDAADAIEQLVKERDAAVADRWVSVKDRMPELVPCNAGTGYSEAVAVLTKGRVVLVAVWDGIDWVGAFDYWDAMGEDVTHWKPLIPLPKEADHEQAD